MTALANSPAFWIGLMAALAAPYVLPTMIAVIRHVENIPLVVFLNCLPIAWPTRASRGMHDVTQGLLTGEPACISLWTLTPSPSYGDGVSAAWGRSANGITRPQGPVSQVGRFNDSPTAALLCRRDDCQPADEVHVVLDDFGQRLGRYARRQS